MNQKNDNEVSRVSIPELADDINCPKQTLFKIANRLKISLIKQRDPERGNQLVSTVSKSDAERLKVEYESRPRTSATYHEDTEYSALDDGVFYLIQLEPELDPGRIKLGFTADMPSRLRKHRCTAPFAACIKTWSCRRTWERTAIDCITNGLEQVHTEVFRCSNIENVLSKADSFFSMMPAVVSVSEDQEPN